MFSKVFAIAAALAGVLLSCPARAVCLASTQTVSRPHSISKTSTWVTGPLKEDGSIDFVAAANKAFSHGISPENNAAAAIIGLISPDEPWRENDVDRDKLLSLPGIGVEIQQFGSFSEFAESRSLDIDLLREKLRSLEGENYDQSPGNRIPDFGAGTGRIPEIDDYLEANDMVLDELVSASNRPGWHVPIVERDEGLWLLDDSRAVSSFIRRSCQLLGARATHRIAKGRLVEAWMDVVAIKRTAGLMRKSPFAMDLVHSNCVDQLACSLAALLLSNAEFAGNMDPEKLIQDWPIDLDPAFLKQQVTNTERLGMIQLQVLLANGRGPLMNRTSRLFRENSRSVSIIAFRESIEALPRQVRECIENGETTQWDAGLRWTNAYHDQILAALEFEPSAACETLRKLQEESETEIDGVIGILVRQSNAENKDQTVLGENFAKFCHYTLRPAYDSLLRDCWLCLDCQKVVKTALAIRVFQKRNGRLPDSLDELSDIVPPNTIRESLTGKVFVFWRGGEQVQVSFSGRDAISGNVRQIGSSRYDDDFVIRFQAPLR